MSKVLLIGVKSIKAESIIEENVDDKVLSKVIVNVQEVQLKSILGKELYESVCNEVKAKAQDNTHVIPELTKELLDDYTQPFLIHATVAEFIALNNYKISNKGVQKLNDNSSSSINSNEVEYIKNYYDNFVSTYKSNLIKFLKDNDLNVKGTDTNITLPTIGWFLDNHRCGGNSNSNNTSSIPTAETDPIWTIEKDNYYNKPEIDVLLDGLSPGPAGLNGIYGGDSQPYIYNSDSTILPAPEYQSLYFNSVSYPSVTNITVSGINRDLINVQSWFNAMGDSTNTIKGSLRLFKEFDSSSFVDFNIYSITINGGESGAWFDMNVSYVAGGYTTFINGDNIIVSYTRAGDKGEQGIQGEQGVKGEIGDPAGIVNFANTDLVLTDNRLHSGDLFTKGLSIGQLLYLNLQALNGGIQANESAIYLQHSSEIVLSTPRVTIQSLAVKDDGTKFLIIDEAGKVWYRNINSLGLWIPVGSAVAYNSGNVLIGSVVDDTVNKLQVAGNGVFGNVKIGNGVVTNGVSFSSIAIGFETLKSVTTGAGVAIGYQALSKITTSTNSIGIGYQSLKELISGDWNTALGGATGSAMTTGYYNSLFGYAAGSKITTGYSNSIVGMNAGNKINTGYNNVCIGAYAGAAINSGFENTCIGSYAGLNITTGTSNIFVGKNAGYFNNIGYENSFIGRSAGYSNTAGYRNAFLGEQSGYNNTTGFNNTYVGNASGLGIQSGNSNTIIGANVTGLSPTLSNTIIIADGDGNQRLNISNVGLLKLGSYGTGVHSGTATYNLQVDAGGNIIEGSAAIIAWPLTGISGTNPATNFIGTIDNVDFVLKTNNTERLRVLASGNIGIGIAVPTDALYVKNYSGTTGITIAGDGPTLTFLDTNSIVSGTIGISGTDASLTRGLYFRTPGVTGASSVSDNWFVGRFGGANNKVCFGDDGTTSYLQSGHKLYLRSARVGSTGQVETTPDMVLSSGSVLIGGTTVLASAILNIESTTKGILFPRLTTTQKTAIASPANGLMVYDTTLNKLCIYEASTWKQFTST